MERPRFRLEGITSYQSRFVGPSTPIYAILTRFGDLGFTSGGHSARRALLFEGSIYLIERLCGALVKGKAGYADRYEAIFIRF